MATDQVRGGLVPLGAGAALVRDKLRALLARFIVKYLTRPHVIRACLWLAAHTDDLNKKRRCLREILYVDPENEGATLALLLLD